MSREYFDTLKQYIGVLGMRLNTKERIYSQDYKQRVAICKDLQGLVAKNFEDKEYENETQELLTDKIIPYVSKVIRWEEDPVSAEKQMEVLKDMYRMAGKRSLKHFILFYEWDWGEKTKFFEPRQDILNGYCYYLQKLVTDARIFECFGGTP